MITKTLESSPMAPATAESESSWQTTVGAAFPAVLLVTGVGDELSWIHRALSHDAFTTRSVVETVTSSTAALGQLHVQPFHALVVHHTPPSADALDLLDALHLAGVAQPVIVLADELSPPLVNRCYELGADAVLCFDDLTQEALIAVVARAVERFELRRETERLAGQERRRLIKDHQEAEQLLQQQRLMIRELEAARVSSSELFSSPSASNDEFEATCNHEPSRRDDPMTPSGADARHDLPEELVLHYRELLRTYVIMGSGSLVGEIGSLSQLFVAAGTGPEAVMSLHLEAIEQLVRGLGRRSRRHVMSRAHLLALEVMVHLARRYQQCSSEPTSGQHKS